VLALGPAILAGGYWAFGWLSPEPSPWFIRDGTPPIILPEAAPGYHWKLTNDGLKQVPSAQMTMHAETITTPTEFASLIGSHRTIIHLDVDWAVQAIQSRKPIARLRDRLKSDPRYEGVSFHRIDCSQQEGPLWNSLLDWCQSNQLGNYLAYGGNGALIWIKEGHVMESVDFAAKHSTDELFAKTNDAFADK
jgi:hypothetical protein